MMNPFSFKQQGVLVLFKKHTIHESCIFSTVCIFLITVKSKIHVRCGGNRIVTTYSESYHIVGIVTY